MRFGVLQSRCFITVSTKLVLRISGSVVTSSMPYHPHFANYSLTYFNPRGKGSDKLLVKMSSAFKDYTAGCDHDADYVDEPMMRILMTRILKVFHCLRDSVLYHHPPPWQQVAVQATFEFLFRSYIHLYMAPKSFRAFTLDISYWKI